MTTEIERLQARIRDLGAQLHEAEEALLAERFKNVPRRSKGDRVLVARKLFGKIKWWPAEIAGVHLRYSEGIDNNGTPWQNHHVSYAVWLQQRDGSFGGSSEGYYAHEVLDAPEAPAGEQ